MTSKKLLSALGGIYFGIIVKFCEVFNGSICYFRHGRKAKDSLCLAKILCAFLNRSTRTEVEQGTLVLVIRNSIFGKFCIKSIFPASNFMALPFTTVLLSMPDGVPCIKTSIAKTHLFNSIFFSAIFKEGSILKNCSIPNAMVVL